MRGRRGGLAARVGVLGAFALAVGLLFASSASASGWVFKETFGSANVPTFVKPLALAVDQSSGDLLVVDAGAKTISRFKPNGEPDPFSALAGSNVIDGLGGADETPPPHGLEVSSFAQEVQIAVDDSGGVADGDIYLTQSGRHVVYVFRSDGTFLKQLTTSSEGAFGEICGTSVDGAGNLYLGDFGGHIHKFAPTSNSPYEATNTANFPFAEACTLAAGAGPTAGFLFANHYNGELFKLDAGSGASKYKVATSDVTVAANPANGHVFAPKESEVREYDASGPTAPTEPIEHFPPHVSSNVRGVAVDGASKLLYLANSVSSTIEVWKEQGALPIVETSPAEAIEVEGATLIGTVNPNGLAVSECFFEYDTAPYTEAQDPGSEAEPAHGQTAPCAEYEAGGEWHPLLSPAELGEGSSPVPVRGKASALDSGTTHHFRLDAANENGTAAGEDETFKTLGAQISEVSAAPISATAARINAWIDPNSEATTFHLQYTTKAAFEASGWSGASATSAAAVPSESTATGDLSAASGHGDLSAGSNLITNVATEEGEFAVGQAIEGTGIPAEARINAIDTINHRLTLSKAATATGSSVALTAGSKTITSLTTTSGRFLPEQNGLKQTLSGAGIAPGTTIVSVTGTEMVLSRPATAAGEGVALSAIGPQAVHAQLTGLVPETPYLYRVVATSAQEAHSPAKAFTTYEAAGPPLPDNRAYELVSPTRKTGEAIPPNANTGLGGTCQECLPGETTPTMPAQSTPGGEGVLYEGQPFSEGLYSGPNEYVSGRSASGWSWQSLNGPATTGTWQAFSADFSRGVLSQEEPPLSPLAPSRGGHGFAELYLREAGGNLVALITAEPPNRDPGALNFANKLRLRYSGANAGSASVQPLTHVAFEANDSLTEAIPGIAPAAPDPGAGQECTGGGVCELYEWSGGALHLVNVLPGNTEAAGEAVIGSGRLLDQTSAEFEVPNTSHAVSDDGRTIFWSSAQSGHVYARIDAERTLQVPGPATCKDSEPLAARACFLTASPDGSEVLLSNGVFYALNGLGSAYEEVADLTAGEGGFQGILGASQDLARVYFVDSKVLTGAEENANGEAAQEGANNLYAWQAGATAFVGRLTSKDGSFGVGGRYGAWRASPSNRSAQASADGRFLAFMSRAPLTGYDNDHASGGGCFRGNPDPACFEVFEYAADTDSLSCASCNPSGQPPIGAANLSLLAPKGIAPPFRQPGNLSRAGEGRLFFESQDALSPRDTNGSIQDVYEWEPQGVGSCAKPAGCVALISSGTAAGDSMFVDSSSSGDDAFFITRSRLLPKDENEQLDLYDARVGGGFPEEAAQSCSGEACRGPLAEAPFEPSAGSASLLGPGNPKQPKHPHKGKAQKKKHHHNHTKHKRRKRGGAK